MFRFLSTLFSGATPAPGAPDRSLVETAIERLIDGTDPRLRGFLNYRARLYDPVAGAVRHVLELIDGLPAPVEISRAAYADDARLRAFFASPAQMREILRDAQSLQDAVHTPGVAASGRVFALLSMDMQERKMLGMELQGDQVRRDVLQDVVNFSNHRLVCASDSAAETGRQLELRAFDFLVEQALKRVLSSKEVRVELEYQRLLLQRKLDAMQAGDWGLSSMLTGTETRHRDRDQLEQQIAAVEEELAAHSDRPADIEDRFAMINAVMSEPAEWLAVREVPLRVDAMLVKREGPEDDAIPPISLTEVYSAGGESRIILPGYIPRDEIPPPTDGLDAARQLLG
jgi:hypothetical protein